MYETILDLQYHSTPIHHHHYHHPTHTIHQNLFNEQPDHIERDDDMIHHPPSRHLSPESWSRAMKLPSRHNLKGSFGKFSPTFINRNNNNLWQNEENEEEDEEKEEENHEEEEHQKKEENYENQKKKRQDEDILKEQWVDHDASPYSKNHNFGTQPFQHEESQSEDDDHNSNHHHHYKENTHHYYNETGKGTSYSMDPKQSTHKHAPFSDPELEAIYTTEPSGKAEQQNFHNEEDFNEENENEKKRDVETSRSTGQNGFHQRFNETDIEENRYSRNDDRSKLHHEVENRERGFQQSRLEEQERLGIILAQTMDRLVQVNEGVRKVGQGFPPSFFNHLYTYFTKFIFRKCILFIYLTYFFSSKSIKIRILKI